MKTKLTLFRRNGIYYSQDSTTGKQKSLGTRDEAAARKLVAATNEAHRTVAHDRGAVELHTARMKDVTAPVDQRCIAIQSRHLRCIRLRLITRQVSARFGQHPIGKPDTGQTRCLVLSVRRCTAKIREFVPFHFRPPCRRSRPGCASSSG